MTVIRPFQAPAASNYGANIGKIVYISDSAAREVTLCADGTTIPIGIITDAVSANGGRVDVCVSGICKHLLGGAITETQPFIAATTGGVGTAGAAADYCVGRAILHADGASGDYVDVDVSPMQLDSDT